ncbi:DUF732 domain-containing protein [Mycobacterium holsaticum]|uniref:DUF732 domain-containing protein n=1 Tax=Mycolicibacterium holsaticum TaxID=152142 RepID=UPI0010426120
MGLAVTGVAAAIVAAPPIDAQPAGYSEQDNMYYHLLTVPNENFPGFVITNFPLMRSQGLTACRWMDNGVHGLDVVHQLQVVGPYSFAAASRIVSAATVSYCRQHLNI